MCIQEKGCPFIGLIIRHNFKDNKMSIVFQKKLQHISIHSFTIK